MSSLTRAEETTLALVAGGKLSPDATHVNMLVTLGYAETDGRTVTLTPKGRKFLDDRREGPVSDIDFMKEAGRGTPHDYGPW